MVGILLLLALEFMYGKHYDTDGSNSIHIAPVNVIELDSTLSIISKPVNQTTECGL